MLQAALWDSSERLRYFLPVIRGGASRWVFAFKGKDKRPPRSPRMPEENNALSVRPIKSTGSRKCQKTAENVTRREPKPRSAAQGKKQERRMPKVSREELSLLFEELDLTQYHEAGHAVAFYLYGF